MNVQRLDLNCDLGEGCEFDRELMPLITSANIACGFHAGEPATAYATLTAAVKHGVVIGAHPGFADRDHFGRRELQRTQQQVYEDCVYQIGALMGLARAAGGEVKYVKPHGALYNMACRDDRYALPVIAAVELFQLPVVGLPGSSLQRLCEDRCRFIPEGFADRRYQTDGTLVPRSHPDAFVEDVEEALKQMEKLIHKDGVETICVHGDNPRAIAFVQGLRFAFAQKGIAVKSFL